MKPTKKYLKELVELTKARMVSTARHYGLAEDDIPDRHWVKLSAVLSAQTLHEASTLAEKAWDSVFVGTLAMWSKGEISGPTTPESLEKKAKQAEGLAKMLANKGDDAAAKKQIKKAEVFTKEAVRMRADNAD